MAQKEKTFSNITLLAIDAALMAGDILRQGFGTHFAISSKEGTHNLVTEYDHKAEKAIIDFLKSSLPESHFLAEESGGKPEKKALLWIIDPLDGTVNFAHQIPIFSVSIAAVQEGKLVSGVVYQPITHELFVAEKDQGAFCNGKKLHVSSAKILEESILATGFPYNLAKNPSHCIEHFVDILRLGIPIRRMGSAAIDLAYTASGRLEGFFEVALQPWDVAAGKLILEEAGGKVTHWDGKPLDLYSNGSVLASNGHIHEAMSRVLTRVI